MASNASPSCLSPQFPAGFELLRPRTWRNRGSLVGPGKPDARREAGQAPSLLAIHGFGGTPREVDLLVDIAQQKGLSATAPLLPGHGTRIKDLATTSFEDWLSAARFEFDQLHAHGEVILAGLSLGAVIAARLAADAPVAGLALLANAVWLKSPYPARWLAVAEHMHLPNSWWVPKLAPDIDDSERRKEHLGYDAQLICAALEVYRGGRDVQRRLRDITCPTLLIHGALDKVCPVSNLRRVAEALGTNDTRSIILRKSGHIVTRDRESADVAREFEGFLARFI